MRIKINPRPWYFDIWYRWYAWYPVRLENTHEYAWLETVEKRRRYAHDCFWNEYRELKND